MRPVEWVVLVDDDGEPIGRLEKHRAHHAETPLHLAFSFYGFDADGRLLATRRASTKRSFPGLWTNTCCGHPGPGESGEAAVRRRVDQELGLHPTGLRCALPRFRYRARMGDVVENEICPVYLGRVDGSVTPDPAEVDECEWVEWEAFLAFAEEGGRGLSPWAALQVRRLEAEGHVRRFLEGASGALPGVRVARAAAAWASLGLGARARPASRPGRLLCGRSAATVLLRTARRGAFGVEGARRRRRAAPLSAAARSVADSSRR